MRDRPFGEMVQGRQQDIPVFRRATHDTAAPRRVHRPIRQVSTITADMVTAEKWLPPKWLPPKHREVCREKIVCVL